MLKTIIQAIAAKLPMKDEEYSFTDAVSGKPVNEYTELFTGRPCLANYCWSWDRVYTDTSFDEIMKELDDDIS